MSEDLYADLGINRAATDTEVRALLHAEFQFVVVDPTSAMSLRRLALVALSISANACQPHQTCVITQGPSKFGCTEILQAMHIFCEVAIQNKGRKVSNHRLKGKAFQLLVPLLPMQIRRTYRSLITKLHPDKAGGDPVAFAKVHKAYEVLSNAPKVRGIGIGCPFQMEESN